MRSWGATREVMMLSRTEILEARSPRQIRTRLTRLREKETTILSVRRDVEMLEM